jgi:hypothetical protein
MLYSPETLIALLAHGPSDLIFFVGILGLLLSLFGQALNGFAVRQHLLGSVQNTSSHSPLMLPSAFWLQLHSFTFVHGSSKSFQSHHESLSWNPLFFGADSSFLESMRTSEVRP